MTYAIFLLPRTLRRSQEQLTEKLKLFEARIKAKEEQEQAELLASGAITEGQGASYSGEQQAITDQPEGDDSPNNKKEL